MVVVSSIGSGSEKEMKMKARQLGSYRAFIVKYEYKELDQHLLHLQVEVLEPKYLPKRATLRYLV